MLMFEDILYEKDEKAITGFINSSGDLEYSIYEYTDGGFIYLQDRSYSKDELSNLLETELEDFIDRNKFTTIIIGHNIHIVLVNGKDIATDDLDEEVYEISQSVLDGNTSGDIFIESIKEEAYWKIVR